MGFNRTGVRRRFPDWQPDPTAIASLLLLLAGTLIGCISPADRIYDEAHYFTNTGRLLSDGVGTAFFSEMLGPTGPLHNFTQVLFSWCAGTSPVAMRWHNFLLVIATLAFAAVRHGAEPGDCARAVVLGFAMPGVWVVSMMALTEAPSAFFLMLSLVLLSRAMNPTGRSSHAIYGLAGAMLSIAATGRQTLVCLSPMLWGLKGIRPRAISARACATFNAAALVVPGLLFAAWGGIQPPDNHVGAYRSHGLFSVQHLLLGLGYAAIYFLIIAPSFFVRTRNITTLLACGVAAIALVLAIDIRMTPMNAWLEHCGWIRDAISHGFPAVIIGLGLLFVFNGARRVFGEAECFEVVLWIGLAGLVFTAGTVVHQFSSRYIAQGYPLFVLLALRLRDRKSVLDQSMPLVGALLGLASILGYYRGP